jgi:2-amino-4-hydroxy-6-hydroxymethyldihydropteridine diphosphokinase
VSEEREGYLGLGSNVGDRHAHLLAALDLLAAHEVAVEAVSSAYETEPVGEILDQPDFLNAAARVRTGLGPETLLDVCKAIEVEQGRMLAGPRHGPRPLDVDLLLLDDLELETERLTLPHLAAVRPGAAARARPRPDPARRHPPRRGARAARVGRAGRAGRRRLGTRERLEPGRRQHTRSRR